MDSICQYYNQNCTLNFSPTSDVLPHPPQFWQSIEINDIPVTYCNVHICYCYACLTYDPQNLKATIQINAVLFDNPNCFNQINWPFIRQSIIESIATQHSGDCFSTLPPCSPPHQPYWTLEFSIGLCYGFLLVSSYAKFWICMVITMR